MTALLLAVVAAVQIAPFDHLSFELRAYERPPQRVRTLTAQSFGKDGAGVFLGGRDKYGQKYGVKTPSLLAVTPGELCDIAFDGRAADLTDTFIVYIEPFDAAGRNVSAQCPAPKDWTYSDCSRTFYVGGVQLSKAGAWCEKKLTFRVPEGVAQMRVWVCPWRGAGVGCRSLAVTARTGLVSRRVELREVATSEPDVRMFASAADQLILRVKGTKTAEGGCTLEATVADEAKPPRPRALDMRLVVEKPLAGWSWHATWRRDEPIAGDCAFRNDHNASGHPVSSYPFTAVSKDGRGFAVAMPIDRPAYESRVVTTNGIVSSVAVGLLARPAGGTSATYTWQIFPFRGKAGFRSAARAYYALQGDRFPEPRAGAREGTWLWPVWPSKLPERPEDYGLTFWEASGLVARNPNEIANAHAHGIEVFPYAEPWGMRQHIATAADGSQPTVEERLAELRYWASTNEPKKAWFGAPRHVAAQAALNSLPIQPDGSHPFKVERWDAWTHWWRTNSDPRLAKPNRASLFWESVFPDEENIDRVDGIYLDSLCYGYAVNYCNIRPEHLAVMDEPLVYDCETAQPCADGMQHQMTFVRDLAKRLHAHGKRIFANVFGIAHRLHATSVDVFGSEIGSWGAPGAETRFHDAKSDEEACEKRFFARHRPVTDLLQEGWYHEPKPELSAAGMTNYVMRQVFYAFYPGVSTIGGEKKPGYANWLRYFGPQRQCERDRELFRNAVPVIRRLNRAGWQPEPEVASSVPSVWIERYGSLPDECLITLRNASDTVQTTVLSFDGATPQLMPAWQGSPAPQSATNGVTFTLRPWQTAVYALAPTNLLYCSHLPTGTAEERN